MARVRDSYAKRMQSIARKFMEAYGVTQFDPDDVYDFADREGLWEPKAASARRQFKRDLSRALAAEYADDPQGRSVRQMHPVPVRSGEQLTWHWAAIYSMTPAEWRLSCRIRRGGHLAGVKQQRRDEDSWNDNNIHGAHVDPSDMNFNKDLAESELPTTYDDEPPGDDQ